MIGDFALADLFTFGRQVKGPQMAKSSVDRALTSIGGESRAYSGALEG